MFNKKHIIIFLALLVACMSIAVAADADDATISSDVTDAVEADSTTTVQTQAVTSVSEDNNYKTIEKENKTVKQEEYNPVVTSEAEYNDSFENNSLNCVQTRNNMLTKNSVKEVKTDDGQDEGTEYYWVYNYKGDKITYYVYQNGTVRILLKTSEEARVIFDKENVNLEIDIDFNNLGVEVNTIVFDLQTSRTTNNYDVAGFTLIFNYEVDKENIDVIFEGNGNTLTLKKCYNGDKNFQVGTDFKSTTFQNINIYMQNVENIDDWMYSGMDILSNVYINNSTLTVDYPGQWPDFPPMTIKNNVTIENSNINIEIPKLDVGYQTIPENGIRFTSQQDNTYTTLRNNTIMITSHEKDSSLDINEYYGNAFVISGDNFILADNEVIVRYVKPLLITSSNAIIENNTITSMSTDYTINITGDNNIVRYNTLTAGENEGDATVIVTGENNVVEQNPYVEVVNPELRINPVEFNVGSAANISASIYLGDDVASDINKGKVTFKVNGKTLKDTKGKVIYAKVVNGTATIENYEVPLDWAKNGSTIQAVYSGSTQCDKLSSEKTEITVQKTVPTLTTENITATAGNTITLTATITDNNQIINTGKVVFKINGKTVKDTNGKVIYAKVVNNQVSVEYTLPKDMKTGTYNITAVFTGSGYDKLEDVKTLTVN